MNSNRFINKAQFGLFVILAFFVMASAGWTATYYVDATNGNDYNNGLSPSTPWKTIAKVNDSSFNPGDQILFKRGKVWQEQLTAPSSGSAGSPITFGAYGNGEKPIISGADVLTSWILVGGSVYSKPGITTEPNQVFYNTIRLRKNAGAITVVGINEWDWNSNTVYVNVGANPANGIVEAGARDHVFMNGGQSYITVENLVLEKANHAVGSGVWISGIGASKNVISNCTIRYNYFGVTFYTTDAQSGGHAIKDCNIYGNLRHAVYVNDGSDGSSAGNRTTVKGNTIHNNAGFGIFCYASYWIIEENILYDNGDHSTETGIGGIHLWAGQVGAEVIDAGKNNIVRYNIVSDTLSLGNDGTGIQADIYADNNEIYYNICFNNDGPGIAIFASQNNKVYNNVSYNNNQNTSGELIRKAEIRITETLEHANINTILKNNIAYATQTETYAIYIGENIHDNNIEIDANVNYKQNGDWYYWNGRTGSNISTWNALPGVGNDINSDPFFQDTLNNYFILRSDSPCVDAGADVGLVKDFRGTPVPQGSGVDIGAIEYKEDTNRPTPPTGLRIQ